MTVIAVTGGRTYDDLATVRRVIAYYSPSLVIHGGATGADSLAESVARELGIQTERHDADWLTHGRAAGPIRNQQMIDRLPDMVIAFQGGRGTEDMKRRARKAGIPVVEVA